MTPAPVWSRLLVSLTSCALMALGLRDMLAPGLVLQSVPGDAQLQAVWGSLGEGWARQHAQHIAGAGDGVGTATPSCALTPTSASSMNRRHATLCRSRSGRGRGRGGRREGARTTEVACRVAWLC